MKKGTKILLGIASGIAALVLAAACCVEIGRHRADRLLHEHLYAQNLTDADISRYSIKYSFLNKLLSYHEWVIEVVFTDEPDVLYYYSYGNGGIHQSGTTGHLNDKKAGASKENLNHLEI